MNFNHSLYICLLSFTELNDIIDAEWPEAAQLVVPQQIYAAIKELQVLLSLHVRYLCARRAQKLNAQMSYAHTHGVYL